MPSIQSVPQIYFCIAEKANVLKDPVAQKYIWRAIKCAMKMAFPIDHKQQ